MKELIDKPSSIGAPISEDQVLHQPVVTALEARVHDLTIDFVQHQLIHLERKLKTQVWKIEVLHDFALVRAQKQQTPKVLDL